MTIAAAGLHPGDSSTMTGIVRSVSSSTRHGFSKSRLLSIRLIAGLGVEGDAHAGATVKHRSRVRHNPTQPNLRQVHLIHEELFETLQAKGFSVQSGELGENITTQRVDLLSLPVDTLLRIGSEAVVQIKGLRNPCSQIDKFQPGLMRAMIGRHRDGSIAPLCGVMGIVIASGEVMTGDTIRITLPPEPRLPLECV